MYPGILTKHTQNTYIKTMLQGEYITTQRGVRDRESYINTNTNILTCSIKRDKTRDESARYGAIATMYYSLQYLLSVLTTYTCACTVPRVPRSLDEGITRESSEA